MQALIGCFVEYVPKIMTAFPVTLEIMGMSLLLSIVIGIVIAAGSLSRAKFPAAFCRGYISFMRGIPTLVLIFLIYLGLPQLMAGFGIYMNNVSTTAYIIVTLSLSSSANMAEMMRSSYIAVDKGQMEAAYSVGMTTGDALRRIVIPQAVGIAIPTLGNNIIMLFKSTSLAFTVGVLDILGKARAISAASYGANRLNVYVATAFIFWATCALLERLFKIIEKISTRGRRAAAS